MGCLRNKSEFAATIAVFVAQPSIIPLPNEINVTIGPCPVERSGRILRKVSCIIALIRRETGSAEIDISIRSLEHVGLIVIAEYVITDLQRQPPFKFILHPSF